MQLLPIQLELNANKAFLENPDCQDSLQMSIDYFAQIGYESPWIGYYAQYNDELVGSAAFKGKPKDGKVEIAYGTFPKHQHKGIGTMICGQLVQISLQTDPTVRITARTLPEESYSTRILQKNGFMLLGTIWDDEDGDVWEWEYRNEKA